MALTLFARCESEAATAIGQTWGELDFNSVASIGSNLAGAVGGVNRETFERLPGGFARRFRGDSLLRGL
jgi:hypothetical protein